MTLDDAKREIVESKKLIEEKIKMQVTAFAYPLGRSSDYNNEIIKIVKEGNFTCAVIDYPTNMVKKGMDIFKLPRISPGADVKIFKLIISGFYKDFKSLISKARKGI